MEPRPAPKAKAPRRALRFGSPRAKILLSIGLFGLIFISGTFLHYYNFYSHIIDRKLSGEVFKNTAKIYAAPFRVYAGQRLTVDTVVARLQRAGLDTPDRAAEAGSYIQIGNRLDIRPRTGDALSLTIVNRSVTRVTRLGGGDLGEAALPPELVTNLFDASRQKRRLADYSELPAHLVDALIAAEDQRFRSHWGVDPIGIAGALIGNLRESDRLRGGSTITQQLARNIFNELLPSSDRSLRRKIPEAFMALLLEQRLAKDQILAMYANDVYLGQRGSFSIHGFGEGAAAYFGKDLGQLTVAESAILVGIIPAPNVFSPRKNMDRARTRRNLVLNSMAELGSLSPEAVERAKAEEIVLAPVKMDGSDAPYLVDYLREELLKDFTEEALVNDSLRVYTSLDPDLQRAAVDAVEKGLKLVQEQIAARNRGRRRVDPGAAPQAAMIALDPRTGEIKAMVGGGDYGSSQLNRITHAFRQPGSIFKPIVYAAAFETAYDGQTDAADTETGSEPPATPATPDDASPFLSQRPPVSVITPVTSLVDEPTTFTYEADKIYEPNNYHEQYLGTVTVRQALQRSLNIPTIKIAEQIGYQRVADMASRLGLNKNVKGYPSIALGAFEVTPIEMAGVYTAFANQGRRSEPHALSRVLTDDYRALKTYNAQPKEVLRPEIAYMMTNLMESVVNEGTGAGIRSRGFTLPAAGKTGSSRDGWFAGYTKELLAIAWVGYDDNRDLNLEGARSALPIWAEFMIRATKLYPPRNIDALYFSSPEGVEFHIVDPESGQLATPMCTTKVEDVFIVGTGPVTYCHLHPTRTTHSFPDSHSIHSHAGK